MPKISKKGPDRQGPKSQKAQDREAKLFNVIAIVVAATVVIQLLSQVVMSWRSGSHLDDEISAKKAARTLFLQEEDNKFQQELSIAKNAATEQLAVKKHIAEMQRRKAREPKLAASEREKIMLQMKAMAPAAGEAPEEFLKKLVKLGCPKKSGVGVSPGAAGGWAIEVAFPYSRVTEGHPEYKTYLPGLYLEVRKMTAAITQDILTYGGPLGIESVVVRCQGSVTVQTPGGVKKEKRDMFGIALGNDGRDWSQYSIDEMQKLWTVTTDEFPAMIANTGATP